MYPTIVLENFFDEPNNLVELSKTYEYFEPQHLKDWWPGERTNEIMDINLKNLVFTKVLNLYFKKWVSYKGTMFFHRTSKNTHKGYGSTDHIHNDTDVIIAGLIYLNNNSSSTAIYDEHKRKKMIVNNNFNTMVTYDAKQNHGPILTEEERITIPFFVHDVKI